MSFADLFNAPDTLDIAETKAKLPIRFAAAQLGIYFDADGKATCPFHDDRRPSLKAWTAADGTERVTCHPCNFTEDVLGLIVRETGCTFPEALERAEEMLTGLPEGYVPARPAPRKPFSDLEVNRARLHAQKVPGLISTLSGFVMPGDEDLARQWDAYLRDVWGWGISPAGTIYMPHWNTEGVMVGCKIRRGSKTSVPGSDFSNLFGSWRPRTHPRVLLTEGETDTVYAAALGLEIDVLGLPSGCGSAIRDEWLELIVNGYAGRIDSGTFPFEPRVYLAFDNDDAGRAETHKWLKTLDTRAVSVKIIDLPDGTDLRSSAVDVGALLP